MRLPRCPHAHCGGTIVPNGYDEQARCSLCGRTEEEPEVPRPPPIRGPSIERTAAQDRAAQADCRRQYLKAGEPWP